MRYFNYHAKVKKLISEGHCTGFELVESYHGISPAIVIHFDSSPPMPIRLHRFEEYFEIFDKFKIKPIKKTPD